MSTVPQPFVTPEEYLEIERAAEYKSEYYRGEMFAMSGGSLPHGMLQSALSRVVGNRLDLEKCSTVSSDVRVQVSATGLCTYPDFLVICGAPLLADRTRDTLLNPVLITEVLSPSTEAYDRTDKFAHYRTIETLKHYMLVSQDRMLVEVFTRSDAMWQFSAASEPGDLVPLAAISVEFPVEELYRGIDLTQAPPSRWPKKNP